MPPPPFKPPAPSRPRVPAAYQPFAAAQRQAAPAKPAVPPAYRPPATPAPATPARAVVPPKVIQRYSTYAAAKNWGGLGTAMRVSDDGKMAVPDSAIFEGTKYLYATADVITAANVRLAAVAAPYRLVQTAHSIQGRTPWSLFSRTLYRVSPRDSRSVGGVGVLGGSGDNLRTLENCSAHGFDSMGVGADAPAQAASGRQFRIAVGGGAFVRNSGDGGHATHSDLIAKQRIFEAIHRHKNGLGAGVAVDRETARETYVELTKSERLRYARMFGMNEYAMPQVGDGIEALRGVDDNFQGFPMHFAAVVARSGNDYVTLENWAKSAHTRAPGDTGDASNAWYFRMYGIEKQSYGREHAREGSIADKAHMISLVNQNA